MPRKRVHPLSPPTHDEEDQMSKDLTKYVTTSQAAEMLGVKKRQVQKLLREGKIRGMQLGHEWLTYSPSLEKYLGTKSKRGRPSSGEPTIQVEKANGQG